MHFSVHVLLESFFLHICNKYESVSCCALQMSMCRSRGFISPLRRKRPVNCGLWHWAAVRTFSTVALNDASMTNSWTVCSLVVRLLCFCSREGCEVLRLVCLCVCLSVSICSLAYLKPRVRNSGNFSCTLAASPLARSLCNVRAFGARSLYNLGVFGAACLR